MPLSIGVLKATLPTNHVDVDLMFEKCELVTKVWELVEDERRERRRWAMEGREVDGVGR